MSILGIIPARFNSTRFPGKPLVKIQGKPMVLHVYDAAIKAKYIDKVTIATDDDRIFNCAKEYGAAVVMTSKAHLNGTSRCAEVVNGLRQTPEIVINIQGDEPFVKPEQLDVLARIMLENNAQIGTLVKPISHEAEITNPNIVKAALNNDGRAIYFSRSVVPYNRDGNANYYKHLGLYAYKTSVLQALVQLTPDVLENTESLEQLRWLANGYSIYTAQTTIDAIAIDTPEDLEKIKQMYG